MLQKSNSGKGYQTNLKHFKVLGIRRFHLARDNPGMLHLKEMLGERGATPQHEIRTSRRNWKRNRQLLWSSSNCRGNNNKYQLGSLPRILCIIFLYAIGYVKIAAAESPQAHAANIMQPPIQVMLAAPEEFEIAGFAITKMATYSVTARVISLQRYHFDRESRVAPFDLALAWGWLADEHILSHFNFNVQGRRLYYQSKNFTTFTIEEIAGNSANTHIIPANDDIADTIDSLRQDEVVTLQGVLVNVSDSHDWHWDTSLSRDDIGDGACEIIYVTEVIVYRDIALILKVAPYHKA